MTCIEELANKHDLGPALRCPIVEANELGPTFDQYFSIIFQVGKGTMRRNHETIFMLSRNVKDDSSHFLMVPFVKSLASDSEVFSEAAKEQLRKTAQMDRMLDSKRAIKERIGIPESPYCDKFYEQSYSKWSLGKDSDDSKEVRDVMQVDWRPDCYTITQPIHYKDQYHPSGYLCLGIIWQSTGPALDRQQHTKSPVNKADALDCLVSPNIQSGIILA